MKAPDPPTIVPVAERGVLVDFADEISDEVLARVHALDAAMTDEVDAGVVEIVPAPTSLLVCFDPLLTDHEAIADVIRRRLDAPPTEGSTGRRHEIGVCYDGEDAPDLDVVAAQTGLDREEVIAAHLSATFTVANFGFAPGFAYLFGTPAAIQLPRNPSPGPPRPAGSVIVAGQQCIVIPSELATGWFAIGRSPVRMLTDDESDPFLVDVGDTITFHRIDADEFAALSDVDD